jgi:hypothetical protein
VGLLSIVKGVAGGIAKAAGSLLKTVQQALGDLVDKMFSKNKPVCSATAPCPKLAVTAKELLGNAEVKAALEKAWKDSQAGDSAKRHEEGGWIYQNTTTGAITLRRAPAGKQASINLNSPPGVADSVVVGVFHTHPNPTSEGWDPGPSSGDRRVDELHGVPDLIRADDGVHVSGPDTRRGGLTGGSGFPS